MTNVELLSRNGIIVGVNVHGHSGYADEGEDIVCAAVSSAVIMTFNTVTDVLHANADVSVGDGSAVMNISSENAGACQSILQGLKLHLLELSKQYSEFIKVTITEV